MADDPNSHILLTTEDLAKRWGMSYHGLSMQRSRGVGCPWLKLGHKCVRYRLSDVLAYEAANAMGAA